MDTASITCPAPPYEIPLHGEKARGRVALVDAEDAPLVSGYRWRVVENPAKSVGPYAVATIDGKLTGMHNLILGRKNVDHINGLTVDGGNLDNRRCNLRAYEFAWQNSANMRGWSKLHPGLKGIAQVGSGRYEARIGRERSYLGVHDTPEQAAQAYNAAATARWGEWARLNEVAA
jgi:hypothetical protein